jgi:hypothetical protein
MIISASFRLWAVSEILTRHLVLPCPAWESEAPHKLCISLHRPFSDIWKGARKGNLPGRVAICISVMQSATQKF